MSKQIQLTRGKFATVDDKDYKRVSKFKWYYLPTQKLEYAARRLNGTTQYLHRFIIGVPRNLVVDHIDGNGLNCCHANLRVCKFRSNRQNQTKHKIGSSKFKGVSLFRKNRWKASIFENGKSHFLGLYSTQEEAAQAYNRAAKKYHKEYAKLNEI